MDTHYTKDERGTERISLEIAFKAIPGLGDINAAKWTKEMRPPFFMQGDSK